ncbi:MAG: prolyl oligopeptidase family serine peptidase [Phycisphaerales bacterium]
MNTSCQHLGLLVVCLGTFAVSSHARAADQHAVPTASGQETQITLKQITAEQDWIARSPRLARWLIDGSGILYSARREGLVGRDLSDRYLITTDSLVDGEIPLSEVLTVESYKEPFALMTVSGSLTSDRLTRIFTADGDLFVSTSTGVEGSNLSIRQLTQTNVYETSVMFMTDQSRYAFRRGSDWFVGSLGSATEFQAADIRFQDAPDDPEVVREEEIAERDGLQRQQRELFEIIQLEDARRDARRHEDHIWRDIKPTNVPGPFFIGSDRRSRGSWLSPSGDHMLIASAPRTTPVDKTDIMPDYINEDGYVSTSRVRSKVGLETETPVQFHLLDLENERVVEVPFGGLATITDDPLEWLKELNASKDESESATDADEKSVHKPTESESESDDDSANPRAVGSLGVRWSDSGRFAAMMLKSHDNKDRWIALVDVDSIQEKVSESDDDVDSEASDEAPGYVVSVVSAHHLRDEAWINWNFNSFGFVPQSDTLWYISEESGYAHLYTRDPKGAVTQHTRGNFEVRDVRFTHDGRSVFMRTNRNHPGVQELERLDLLSGTYTQLTSMGGTIESYSVSPDEQSAVVSYSNINSPPELCLVELWDVDEPDQLTDTIRDEFLEAGFMTPEIVAIPSSHSDHPVYTRVYAPDATEFPGPRPIVVFSHGAGYLQHANYEWSYYSREHMYHTLLTQQGFIVVSPDFRASEGYGRDWRTAIYRNMGYPELEDFKDAIEYARSNLNGDPSRVGIYGGSYGGFMTLMAMFLEPETFHSGAALRSVTDWQHYNHGYTSNILNTPEIDPESYQRSSPINHAEGLQGNLLMLHGLLDDNVVAQDIIRLSQRLIELEKENWELALAPIEPHGYKEPSSWLDQMRRIHELFMSTLAD